MDTYTIIFCAGVLVAFFARLPLAVWFLNAENGTDHGLFDYSRAEQFVLLIYWYTPQKKENRILACVLNVILIIVGIIFISTIIYAETTTYRK
jgi:hypothetical protein